MLNIGEVTRPVVKVTDTGDPGELMAKNPFYSLLGDCYTIVVSVEITKLPWHKTKLMWCCGRKEPGRRLLWDFGEVVRK